MPNAANVQKSDLKWPNAVVKGLLTMTGPSLFIITLYSFKPSPSSIHLPHPDTPAFRALSTVIQRCSANEAPHEG